MAVEPPPYKSVVVLLLLQDHTGTKYTATSNHEKPLSVAWSVLLKSIDMFITTMTMVQVLVNQWEHQIRQIFLQWKIYKSHSKQIIDLPKLDNQS